MLYTVETVPEPIQQLPIEIREAWIEAFNALMRYHNLVINYKVANSMLSATVRRVERDAYGVALN